MYVSELEIAPYIIITLLSSPEQGQSQNLCHHCRITYPLLLSIGKDVPMVTLAHSQFICLFQPHSFMHGQRFSHPLLAGQGHQGLGPIGF